MYLGNEGTLVELEWKNPYVSNNTKDGNPKAVLELYTIQTLMRTKANKSSSVLNRSVSKEKVTKSSVPQL